MARLPYLEADQVAPEYRDMLKRNTNLHKLLVNSPDMARAFSGIGGYIRHQSKLDPRLRELEARAAERPEGSYTAKLLGDPPLIGDKVREEADEVARAAAGESDERVREEAADVLYHLDVLMASRGLSIREAFEQLNGRRR